MGVANWVRYKVIGRRVLSFGVFYVIVNVFDETVPRYHLTSARLVLSTALQELVVLVLGRVDGNL